MDFDIPNYDSLVMKYFRQLGWDQGYSDVSIGKDVIGPYLRATRNGEEFFWYVGGGFTSINGAVAGLLRDTAKRQDTDAIRILQQAHGL